MILFLFVSIIILMLDFVVGSNPPFEWTPEIEAKLLEIFYATTPGQRDHSSRMKAMWDSILPDKRNVKQKVLRQHACDVIDRIGGQRKRRKDSLPLTSKMRSDLLNMYHRSLSKENPEQTLYDEWRKEYPELSNIEPQDLVRRALHIIKNMKYKEKMGNNEQKLGKVALTEEHKNELLHLYESNPKGARKQGEILYREWIEKHPEFSYMKPKNLQQVAYNLARKRDGIITRKRNFKWTRQMKADLIYIGNQFNIDKYGSHKKSYEVWQKVHPNTGLNYQNVRAHILTLRKTGYKPTEKEKEQAEINFERALQLERSRTRLTAHRGESRFNPRPERTMQNLEHQFQESEHVSGPLAHNELLHNSDVRDKLHHDLLDISGRMPHYNEHTIFQQLDPPENCRFRKKMPVFHKFL